LHIRNFCGVWAFGVSGHAPCCSAIFSSVATVFQTALCMPHANMATRKKAKKKAEKKRVASRSLHPMLKGTLRWSELQLWPGRRAVTSDQNQKSPNQDLELRNGQVAQEHARTPYPPSERIIRTSCHHSDQQSTYAQAK